MNFCSGQIVHFQLTSVGGVLKVFGMNNNKFVVLTTTSERPLANRICAALEDDRIAVMLEHVEIRQGRTKASGFRLLVPSDTIQRAMKIGDKISQNYYRKRPMSIGNTALAN